MQSANATTDEIQFARKNRLDCFQSKILGGVCDGFCVQPNSALNLGNVTIYTTSLRWYRQIK